MRAVVCRAWGGPDQLEIADLPSPTPGPGQVGLKVHAAGVNFADTLIIEGNYQVKPEFPFSPGLEAAGEVSAVGEGVEGLAPGDRVVAIVDHGAFAEEVVAPASSVYRIPDSMDFVTAAGFVVAYGTSHFGLKDKAGLKAGETLAVLGAAGGVGLTAVEVGKQLGATVVAVAGGAEKLKVAQEHGADHLIDYRSEDLTARLKEVTDGRGVDVIYDPVGGAAFDAAFRATARGARILIIGFASGEIPKIPANILLVKNMSAIGYYWGAYARSDPKAVRASTAELMEWFDAGRIRPHVSHTFALEDAGEALKTLKSRASTGKVVVTVR